MPTLATSGSGVILKVGDGGVGAGTQASKTIGTVNQQLRVLAKDAGVAGNSKTFGIIVAGGTVSYSQVITANSVLINAATTSGTVTTKVGQAISSLYADSTFVNNFRADVSSGDGSGLLVAGASGVLSGGADGTEIFTDIAEVKSIGGPNMSSTFIDVTNFSSANNTREFINSWIDPGELSLTCNFLPANATQQALLTAMKNRVVRNFKLQWSDAASTVCTMAGLVTGYQINNQLDQALEVSINIKLTGFPSWF